MKPIVRSVALVLLVSLPALAAADWPHTRGPALDGSLAAPGTFESGNIGLDLAWRVPLGSGYSGIAVADGRVVTLFAEGDGNWVAAFDVKSGKQLWRQRTGDIYKGHDGSDDGPLSSPVIPAGMVYALDPHGALLALGLPTVSRRGPTSSPTISAPRHRTGSKGANSVTPFMLSLERLGRASLIDDYWEVFLLFGAAIQMIDDWNDLEGDLANGHYSYVTLGFDKLHQTQ